MQTILIFWLLFQPLVFVSGQEAPSIIISEVGAHEKSDFEWIEIFNNTDLAVDLSGWKFYEDNTNHGLVAAQGDMIIEPHEYAIIADVATNFLSTHDFSGTVLDSSWSSLLEAGEKIGLKNNNGDLEEEFIYPAVENTSIQKVDLNKNDYSTANWLPHKDSDSAGRANEFNISNETEQEVKQNETSTQSSQPHQVSPMSGTILINEVYPYPNTDEKEWIEIYNNSQQIYNLDEWYLQDGAGNRKFIEGDIVGHSFLLIEYDKSWLNNAGETLKLFDANGNTLDYITWGNWNDDNLLENNLPSPKKGQSLARNIDGGWTNDIVRDFSLTNLPTPSSSNQIDKPVNEKLIELNNSTVSSEQKLTFDKPIRINEVFANPKGSDLMGEFIEIMNVSDKVINLNGWSIKNSSGMTYVFNETNLNPLGLFALKRSASKLALKNDGDKIEIFNPKGNLVDVLAYKVAIEDQSYAYFENGFINTTSPTPAVSNILSTPNQAPIISMVCEKNNGLVSCDASDSYDFNHDEIRFLWTLSKGGVEIRQFVHDIIEVKESEGDLLTLQVSDGQSLSKKDYQINKSVVENKIVKTALAKIEDKPDETLIKVVQDKELFELSDARLDAHYRTNGQITKINKSSFEISDGNEELLIRLAKNSKIQTTSLAQDDNVTISGELRQGKNERYLFSNEDDVLVVEKDTQTNTDVIVESGISKNDQEKVELPITSNPPRIPYLPIVAATTSLLAITWHSLMRRPAWQARAMLWRGRMREYINNLLLRIWRK